MILTKSALFVELTSPLLAPVTRPYNPSPLKSPAATERPYSSSASMEMFAKLLYASY